MGKTSCACWPSPPGPGVLTSPTSLWAASKLRINVVPLWCRPLTNNQRVSWWAQRCWRSICAISSGERFGFTASTAVIMRSTRMVGQPSGLRRRGYAAAAVRFGVMRLAARIAFAAAARIDQFGHSLLALAILQLLHLEGSPPPLAGIASRLRKELFESFRNFSSML